MHLKLAVLNSGDVYEECEIFLSHSSIKSRSPYHTVVLLCCFIISIMFWAIVVFIIIIYVDEEQYIRNQKKIVKKFSISYNEVGNILATENQRAKIIYAIEIK